MKKILISIIILGLLMFSFVSNAFAATVYFDYLIGGKHKKETPENRTFDNSNYLLGLEIPFSQFQIVFECEEGTIDDGNSGTKQDYTTYLLKSGRQFAGNDRCALYGNLSYSKRSWDADGSGNSKYSPIMIGADGIYLINERAFLSGSIDIAIQGKYESGGNSADTDYTTAKVKYTYLFNERISTTFGYNWSEMKSEALNLKMTDQGFTAGLNYNF